MNGQYEKVLNEKLVDRVVESSRGQARNHYKLNTDRNTGN